MAMNRLVQKKQGGMQRRSKQEKAEQNKRGGGSDVEWGCLRESEQKQLFESTKKRLEQSEKKTAELSETLAFETSAKTMILEALDEALDEIAGLKKGLKTKDAELTMTLAALEKADAAAAPVKAPEGTGVTFVMPVPREEPRKASSRKGKGSVEKRKAERASKFGKRDRLIDD